MPPTRTLLLPINAEILDGLFQLHGTAFLMLQNVLVPGGRAVPIPGAPIYDVNEAYWRVLEALPQGTEELVEEKEDYLPDVPMLRDFAGGDLWHLTTIEVAEADLALLAAFADALDRAAGPRPGPEFEELQQALGDIGRQYHYQWMPQGDAAYIARWVRRALSPALHSPFQGPHGAADHELLFKALRRAQDVGVDLDVLDEDEERALNRVVASMTHAALNWP